MEAPHRPYLEELRRLHTRRLQELEKQVAYAGIGVRPEILLEIQDLKGKIAGIDAEIGMLPMPRVLREPVADFVGREEEIEILVQVLSQSAEKGSVAAISGVRGMGGVGKTELAHAVAQRVAPFFPGGQILIEMKGATNPLPTDIALQMILRTMGYAGEFPHEIPQLQQLYRSTLQGQRVLIIADDAKDATQVKPLIPPYGCALLITSRLRFTLPGMTQIDLRMHVCNSTETVRPTFCIRDIRRAYDHIKDITLCINRNMAFPAGDLLSAIKAALADPCGCFDRLAVDHTCGWFDSAGLCQSRFSQDIGMDGDNGPIFRPFLEILANDSRFWEIMRQIAPLATRIKHIKHPIDDPTTLNCGGATRFPTGWLDKRFDDGPVRITHIGHVGGSLHHMLLVSFQDGHSMRLRRNRKPKHLWYSESIRMV